MNASNEPQKDGQGAQVTPKWKRHAFASAGFLLAGIGAVGLFVPLLPTTIFMIIAAGCFARSSPALEARLIGDPRFGPQIMLWREKRAISRKGKTAAAIGITLGAVLFALSGAPLVSKVSTAIVLAAIAAWIWMRPEA